MPARKPPPSGEKSQRERFVETARKMGASEDPEEFEQVFRDVMNPKLGKNPNGATLNAPIRKSPATA